MSSSGWKIERDFVSFIQDEAAISIPEAFVRRTRGCADPIAIHTADGPTTYAWLKINANGIARAVSERMGDRNDPGAIPVSATSHAIAAIWAFESGQDLSSPRRDAATAAASLSSGNWGACVLLADARTLVPAREILENRTLPMVESDRCRAPAALSLTVPRR